MFPNTANPQITHVFVLMLENRSFDHMLGFSGLSGIDSETRKRVLVNGILPGSGNTYQGNAYPALSPADNIMPHDPAHEFLDVLEQLCGDGVKYNGVYPPINNSGFVSSYATSQSTGEGANGGTLAEIMKCYTPAQLPIMTTLAAQFALCDNWYASIPGPTWPNRFFVHAASSGGLDHSPRTIETTEWETVDGFSFPNGNIFQLLDKYKPQNWRIYRGVASPVLGSIPSVAALKGIQLTDTHPYEKFEADINGPYPYAYTFIEPNYGDIVGNTYSGGQSQHPMDDVRNGEALIKSTYEAIRNSPLWPNSLLIVTYDEHGGFYDHVPPPPAIAPRDTVPHSKYNEYGFDFQQYGVRVPALVISAYTPKNTICRTLFDHASIPATLEALFGLPALTARDQNAHNLTSLISLPAPRTDTPATLPDLPAVPAIETAAARARQPIHNDSDPVDGGSLPGFLHIALKGQLENEATDAGRSLRITHFTGSIKTRGDARAYLNQVLPGLLNG